MAASGLLSTLTKEQRAIMEAATLGHSIFITGAARTGKSFVVKNLIEALPEAGLVATSSTGISSVQLSCTVTALFLHILDDYIAVGNQLSKSTWIQRPLSLQNFSKQE